MENRQLLAIQIACCVIAWGAIARAYVAPRLAQLDLHRAVRPWIAPQMFRIIGVTLLAKNVAGAGLDPDFAHWVAYGDFVTCVLAIASFVALKRPGALGIGLAATTTVIGAADLVHNLVLGMRVNAANDLGPAWFVVAIVVPGMLVAHVGAAFRLLRR